jgi:hypothetical protein
MKSKLVWLAVCAGCFGAALAITQLFHLAGIYKWSTTAVALFVGLAILTIWERRK